MSNILTAAASPPRSFFKPRGRLVAAICGGLSASFFVVGQVFAQATSPAGGIGAQINSISSETINSGGTAFNTMFYVGALITFGFGVWALWQSRQPQNREGGMVAKGVAGLILCGLFVAAPSWINKASVTTSGGSAGVNNTPAMVQFGAGAAAAP